MKIIKNRNINEYEKKSDDKNLKTYEINKVLVVLICIEHYDGYKHHKNKAKNLKSTQIDKNIF